MIVDRVTLGRRARGIAATSLLVAALIVSIGLGVIGRDFGNHWDEEFTLRELRAALASGIYLPRYYNYPGATFDLSVLSVAPRLARALAKTGGDAARASADVLAKISKDGFKQDLRIPYIVITETACIGIFCAVLAMRRGIVPATVAGVTFLSSWEMGYHARFIAPDGLLAAATALSLALVLCIFRYPHERRWIQFAAVSAGVAAACKYPGGIMLLAVALACVLRRGRLNRATIGQDCRDIIGAGVIASVVFLLLTPGALVEPLKFAADLHTEMQHYAVGGHGAHSAYGFAAKIYTVASYVAFYCFSDVPPVAAIFAALTLIGAVESVRTDPRRSTVVVGIPLLLLMYFASLRVVFVRNYLMLFPFMAVLSAVGLSAVLERLPGPRARVPAVLAMAALFAFALQQQLAAAMTIRERHRIDYAARIIDFVRNRPGEKIYLAPSAKTLTGKGAALESVGVATLDDANHVIYGSNEFDWFKTYYNESNTNLANHPGVYRLVAGPEEVNWDYYPDWSGDPRLLEVTAAVYRQLKATPPFLK